MAGTSHSAASNRPRLDVRATRTGAVLRGWRRNPSRPMHVGGRGRTIWSRPARSSRNASFSTVAAGNDAPSRSTIASRRTLLGFVRDQLNDSLRGRARTLKLRRMTVDPIGS